MSAPPLQSENLELVPQTLEDVRAMVEAMPPADKAQLSPGWLAQLEASTEANPWIHGYSVVLRADGAVVGQCGYKGPPTDDGIVEIAYAIEPDHWGKGYATEAAAALTAHALGCGRVQAVRAHTLPDGTASQRVLAKCGFRHTGEFVDPEDGLVWRWEKEPSE